MYISSFHIDSFGMLSSVTVEGLCPAINIFLGQNEAGKSTCLEFLRAMLTGYPPDGETGKKYQLPASAHAGGSLLINCESPDGSMEEIRLARRPSPSGAFILEGGDCSPGAERRLDAIFSGISPEVYRKVFGFSLNELESFESLSADGVREALYGASFGPGLISPALALEELKERKESLLHASGLSMNSLMKQLGEKRALIRQKEGEISSYERHCLARNRHKERLARLRLERNGLEARLRVFQNRLSTWRQWDEWRRIKDQLEHMPELPAGFPEHALQRLAQIRSVRDERERELASRRQRLDSLRERREQLVYDTGLVEILPALHSLAGRKNAYRQALNELDGQRESLARAREELADILTRLGPDWDCGRIRRTNRSLFVREDLARHEEEIHSAQLASQAARNSLESANQEVDSCEKAWASAKEALAQFPEPEEVMPPAERYELRRNMARLNECRHLEQTREAAYKSALDAFAKALLQAKIGLDAENADNLLEADRILKNIDSRQEEARALSNELQDREVELISLAQKSARLEESAESIRLKAEAAIAHAQANPAPNRDSIERRGHALRSLRGLGSQLGSAEERLQDLDARINNTLRPGSAVNWALLLTGSLLVLGGGSLFAANYFWGLVEISMADGPSLGINLWMCCLAPVCGLVLLAFGLSANGAEKRRYQKEMAQLQASRTNLTRRMLEYRVQTRQLYEAAGVDSMDPITLDAGEMLLEREKEQCINEERSQRDAENLQRELTAVRDQLNAVQKESRQKESEIQHCRKNWLSLMQSMHITDCPGPESLAAVFARMEAAGIALGNVQAANKDLEALWEDLHLLEASISSMPAIQAQLRSAPGPLSLEEAVRLALEACVEADRAREQRLMALSSVETVENGLASARRRQEAAVLRFEKASQKLEERRQEWADVTSEFGLGENMDPQIMREALRLMDQALLAEEKFVLCERETRRLEKEKQAFEGELAGFLDRLGRGGEDLSDGLLKLDQLLREAGTASATMNERKGLDSLISEHEEEYAAGEAALETAKGQLKALLVQGESANEEDFARKARLAEDMRQGEGNLKILESSLRLAAGEQPLPEFLQSFEVEGREEQEQKLALLEREHAELDKDIQEEAATLGRVEARLEGMIQDNSLAALRQEEAMLKADLESMTREWIKTALAESILLRAKHKFEKERQPEVIRIASDIFSRITGGRWRGLKSSLENGSLEILSRTGESLAPDMLSRGAQEQAWLALRLAYIRDHARRAIPLPLIMDEILVNFDPARAERTAGVLAGLAQNPPPGKTQQLLYFTSQPHIAEMFRRAALDSRLFMLEGGKIRAD